MKKRKKKIIYILILAFYFLAIFTPYVHAGILDDAKTFIGIGANGSGVFQADKAKTQMGPISGMLYNIGLIALIIATIIIGIQFLIASSSEEKSKVKKSAVVVGIMAVILFSTPTIWSLVVGFLSDFT